MARPRKDAQAPSEHIALDAFIAQHEASAQALGIVVTAVSHPDATEGMHTGLYAGFPVTQGEMGVTYSDGTKH